MNWHHVTADNEIVIGKTDNDKVKLAFGYMAGDVDSFIADLDLNAAKNNDATTDKDWVVQPYVAAAKAGNPQVQIKQVGLELY